MAREFTVIVERDEDGWFVGTAAGLRGCSTQGRTIDELLERMKEAILLCLDDEEDGAAEGDSAFVAVHRIAV